MPPDLEAFYCANIAAVGGYRAVTPIWNEHTGWRDGEARLAALLKADAVPIFGDGCGNLFGLDLSAGASPPTVYLFDHEFDFATAEYAAGSSLGAFLLVLGETDRAFAEGRAPGWELAIDPDIDRCPRARASWVNAAP